MPETRQKTTWIGSTAVAVAVADSIERTAAPDLSLLDRNLGIDRLCGEAHDAMACKPWGADAYCCAAVPVD
jgi:hypothetical protein